MSRLVDYHDHISAPPVSVADDLRRVRRRVRRNRSLLAGGVALGLASVIAAVSLFAGEGSADRPQPVGQPATNTTSDPAPDNPGLTAPLVAPKSLLDVRELGFHVEPVRGFEVVPGWAVHLEGQSVTLRWDEAAATVTVDVGYQGVPHDAADRDGLRRVDDVKIHGVPGLYYHYQPEGASAHTQLVWEYAPDSWASVTMSDRGDPGPERLRSALIEVAEAVGPGGETLRLPIRVGTFPSSLPQLATVSHIYVDSDSGSWWAGFDLNGDTRLEVGPGPDAVTCEPGDGGDGVETFTYRGHAGCLSPWGTTDEPRTTSDLVGAISLQVGETVRTFVPSHAGNGPPGYPIADVKQLLAELTVAPLDDPSAWFDLKSALSG